MKDSLIDREFPVMVNNHLQVSRHIIEEKSYNFDRYISRTKREHGENVFVFGSVHTNISCFQVCTASSQRTLVNEFTRLSRMNR